MKIAISQDQAIGWLMEHGPPELERLLRTILHHSSVPALLADNDRQYRDANLGASKILGMPIEELAGRKLEDFAAPGERPQLLERWRDFLKAGEQEGTLVLVGEDGGERELGYLAKKDVLPVRHLLVLREQGAQEWLGADVPASMQDYALSLLDVEGNVAAWYAGAERIFGYESCEAVGEHVSLFDHGTNAQGKGNERLKRAAREGHAGDEGWQLKKNGSRFWANTITMALKDESGILQGYACVVRDFSDRHERDEKLRRGRGNQWALAAEASIAGVVSGEFDCIQDANDQFLDLVGYSRAEFVSSGLRWAELILPQNLALCEVAHEEAIRYGACKPFEIQLVRRDGPLVPVLLTMAVRKLVPFQWTMLVLDLRDLNPLEQAGEEGVGDKNNFAEMIGSSKAIQRVMGQIEMVAPTAAGVLILGETGTGKELIARAIHRMSPRWNRPFVTLNCAAIPTGLLESELFGYERGAFTGALTQKIGRFEMANQGTLFLDEVGDIAMDLQPKLLRALQEKSFERLGGIKTIPIDVRLVAATNRNLMQMMAENLFRSDLYYRLKIFPITAVPLRDRPEDIPLLVRHFTKKFAAKMNRTIQTIPAESMRRFVDWPWPGNIRELENFIERSVILSPGRELNAPLAELENGSQNSFDGSTLEDVERSYILNVLRKSKGCVSLTATRLGVPRTTLNAMMKKLGISRGEI